MANQVKASKMWPAHGAGDSPVAPLQAGDGAGRPIQSEDAWPNEVEGDGPGCWWLCGHNEHLDGDRDGLGAVRGLFVGAALLVVLFGAGVAVAEVGGHLSGAARVGLGAVLIAGLFGWRSVHLFRTWRNWRPAAVGAMTFAVIAAWSLAVWGW